MKRAALFLPILPTFLVACAATPRMEGMHDNPLYVEFYYDALVDQLVDLELQKDPILEEEGMKEKIAQERRDALEKAQEAQQKQRDGTHGNFVEVKEFVKGDVLLSAETLFFGPIFETDPGPALHVYLSGMTDPRDGEFPDGTSVDLGLLRSPIGIQSYEVPKETAGHFVSVVLYDTMLKRMHGFAQLR